METAWTRLAGVQHPIVQAPMGLGATTPALVAAVGRAGAMGCLAAAYTTAAQVAEAVRAIRALTDAPFGVNLFAPLPLPDAPPLAKALARLGQVHSELGLPAPTLPERVADDFDALVGACLDSGARVLSFTMGRLPRGVIEAAQARGMRVAGTATTVDEAVLLAQDGVDAIVAQGSEAGAHRGTFAGPFEDALVGGLALVPQIVDAVRVPVLASGGIMDGRGIAAALALGAAGVQMGTAFLAVDECGVPASYKRAVLAGHEDQTRITRAFSGRPARGLVNRFMREMDQHPDAVLPFPYQNALTRALRAAAGKRDDADYLSLWAGQGVRLARRGTAQGLVDTLMQETHATLRRLAALGQT
jgi:nitronate monooxygenase